MSELQENKSLETVQEDHEASTELEASVAQPAEDLESDSTVAQVELGNVNNQIDTEKEEMSEPEVVQVPSELLLTGAMNDRTSIPSNIEMGSSDNSNVIEAEVIKLPSVKPLLVDSEHIGSSSASINETGSSDMTSDDNITKNDNTNELEVSEMPIKLPDDQGKFEEQNTIERPIDEIDSIDDNKPIDDKANSNQTCEVIELSSDIEDMPIQTTGKSNFRIQNVESLASPQFRASVDHKIIESITLSPESDSEILEVNLNEASDFISFSPLKGDDNQPVARTLSLSPISSDEAEELDAVEGSADLRNQILEDMFKKKLKKYAEALDQLYDKYVEQPHTHPLYDKSWKYFYLENQQKFTKENMLDMWTKFWSKRLQAIKTEEFCIKKEQLRVDMFGYPPEDDNKDEANDCSIIEPEREVIEVSDEDEQAIPCKRRKIEEESGGNSLKEPAAPGDEAEIERMTIAIRIAQEIIKQGLNPKPEDLIRMVKASLKQREQDQCSSNLMDLSNDELKILFHNFEALTADEQNNFMSRMKRIQENPPERYQELWDEIQSSEDME